MTARTRGEAIGDTLNYHPVFWVFVAAVAGPLLGQIPVGFRVPVVVIEVVLGILIGPHVMGLVHYDAFLATMHRIAMAARCSWPEWTSISARSKGGR